MHQVIYRRILQKLVADKGELRDAEMKMLERIRSEFYIPKKIVEAAHSDICGSFFEKVVKDAIAAGVDGYDQEIKKSVRKAVFGLRLTRDFAMSIASKEVRTIFLSYVERARAAGSLTELAKVLKQLIVFNKLVATELVADIEGSTADTPTQEPNNEEKESLVTDEKAEWESLQSLRKARPSTKTTGELTQKEINLQNDISNRDRVGVYNRYLLFCITSEVIRIPAGDHITTKEDNPDYVLLNQLDSVLGLTDREIIDVHKGVAERTLRLGAAVILADGELTKLQIEQLNELQKEVGLQPQNAQKLIKNISALKLSAAGRGRLSIKEIRELKANGIEIDNMISESIREDLFRDTVVDIFSSGTGEFDEGEVYEKIPEDLNIHAMKAKEVVQEVARIRFSDSLMQAVALLYRRRYQGVVVKSLNDLLACDKVVPSSTPVSWEELAGLFLVYLKSDPTAEKLARDSPAEAYEA